MNTLYTNARAALMALQRASEMTREYAISPNMVEIANLVLELARGGFNEVNLMELNGVDSTPSNTSERVGKVAE